MSGEDDNTETRPIGDVVDALSCNARLGPDDLVADVVVLLKVVDGDGRVRLAITWGEGQSWIERRGMLETALDMERVNPGADS